MDVVVHIEFANVQILDPVMKTNDSFKVSCDKQLQHLLFRVNALSQNKQNGAQRKIVLFQYDLLILSGATTVLD